MKLTKELCLLLEHEKRLLLRILAIPPDDPARGLVREELEALHMAIRLEIVRVGDPLEKLVDMAAALTKARKAAKPEKKLRKTGKSR